MGRSDDLRGRAAYEGVAHLRRARSRAAPPAAVAYADAFSRAADTLMTSMPWNFVWCTDEA